MNPSKAPATDEPAKVKRVPRAERELQMLEAAAQLFGEKGFEATSMDDVAQACGVTKPMIYSYFQSKEGLYAAMINRAGTHLVTAFLEIGKETSPKIRLHKALHVFLDFVERYGGSWRMVFSTAPNGKSDIGAIAGYRKQILQATIYTLGKFRPEGMSGEIARPLTEPYAHALLGAGEAIAQWWLSSPDKTKLDAEKILDEFIETTIGLVLNKLNSH